MIYVKLLWKIVIFYLFINVLLLLTINKLKRIDFNLRFIEEWKFIEGN